jgi:hypothetical protein
MASHTEPDPYNHTINDTYQHINPDYLYEQVKASVAFAGHLVQPISFDHYSFLPSINFTKPLWILR